MKKDKISYQFPQVTLVFSDLIVKMQLCSQIFFHKAVKLEATKQFPEYYVTS